MNPYSTVSLLGLIAVVQSTFLTRLDASGLHPDLMLLCVIAWSLLRGSREGIAWGFVGGLSLDLLSATPLGVNAMLLASAGYFAGLGESKVFRTNFILPLFIISAITLGYFAAQFGVLQLLGRSMPWFETALRVIVPTLVLNLLVSPLVFRPLRWLSHHTGREQLRW
ncbi:MAG: rod shape-determining protein MreD [Chloroflexota bacterium]